MIEMIGRYVVNPARKKEGCDHKAATLHYRTTSGQLMFLKDFANIEFARFTAHSWARSRPTIPKFEWDGR